MRFSLNEFRKNLFQTSLRVLGMCPSPVDTFAFGTLVELVKVECRFFRQGILYRLFLNGKDFLVADSAPREEFRVNVKMIVPDDLSKLFPIVFALDDEELG